MALYKIEEETIHSKRINICAEYLRRLEENGVYIDWFDFLLDCNDTVVFYDENKALVLLDILETKRRLANFFLYEYNPEEERKLWNK